MIRRGLTRIELKMEDMQEFECVQKTDRRKGLLSCPGAEEAKKLIRQERVGYVGTIASRIPTTSAATSGSRRLHQTTASPPVQPNPRPSTSTQAAVASTIEGQFPPLPLPEDEEMIREFGEMMEANPPHSNTDETAEEIDNPTTLESQLVDDDLE